MNNPKLEVINGNIYATSVEVADKFKKAHDKILRDIEKLKNAVSRATFGGSNPFLNIRFEESNYISSRGKTFRSFNMTRDALALLVFGFTGQEALEWKLKYIAAFNAMEAKLREIEANQNRKEFKQRSFDQLILFPDLKETFLSERPSISISSAYDVMILRGLHIPPISRNQLIDLIKKGKLEGFKDNRKWHVYQDSFSNWLKLRKQSA